MFDLAIIGAGPAGMAAALTAADHGLRVVVIDEQRRAGGQIFRQPPETFTGSEFRPTAGYEWATALIRRFEADTRVVGRFGWSAIGILHEDTDPDTLCVAVNHPARGTGMITARRLLIATGAYDLPVAFPGWTLPGVMAAGGVQTLVKAQKVAPAGDVVLAGAHPLLLLVADLLVGNGVPVREVAFAQSIPAPAEMLRALNAVPGHLRMLAETGTVLTRLLRRGVRVSPRTVVTAAHGTEHVSRVTLTRVDRRWQAKGAPRDVDASHLVVGYGFVASTELARQAGCELTFDSPRGGWVVAHDGRLRTSVPGVSVAGEPSGVAGADASRAEGTLAALALAADLGRPVPAAAFTEAERAVARAARFSTVVQRVFEPGREALGRLATQETIMCRCEMVSRGNVDDFLASAPFVTDVNAVKLSCRTGMGPCQGRYCENTVAGVLAAARDQPIGLGGRFSAHLPVKPVPVGDLCALDTPPREDRATPRDIN
ncbi:MULTISPECIES: NAD(P)/FAD-dependent oxidoreductase [unclassified Streptomyces]|uniref:NAD(P)/FAD-dependent oxidoreductase n=1 Tax=unclassified Streptomyces TaxID=2593676 RepID=UPI000363A5DF|nr:MULTISPECIES: NAD(P)/FAD-dependent oxidoreductase [unclassified Streptomyces]MYY06882.1 FAD-dependent oxidoreductase [Streptomyces sp. SID4913]